MCPLPSTKPSPPPASGGRPSGRTTPVVAFAGPLLAALGHPSSLDEVRGAMSIAAALWNLPLLERSGHPDGEALREIIGVAVGRAPDGLGDLVVERLRARVTEFAQDERLAVVEVRRGDDGGVDVRAVYLPVPEALG
jgi:hypothetical protein